MKRRSDNKDVHTNVFTTYRKYDKAHLLQLDQENTSVGEINST